MIRNGELRDIFGNCAGAGILAGVLDNLTYRAREKDFRKAVRDWSKSQNDTTWEGGAINTMPYGKPGSCRDLLLVISLGRNEFDKRLHEAHDHCAVTCHGITKGVLFVTDFWDNEKFWDLRATTFEKLAKKYGLILAVAIWTGNSFALDKILP